MRRLSLLTLVAFLICSAVLGAQTAAQSNAVKLRGKVVDTTGGAMNGADVQVMTGTGNSARALISGKTNSEGDFELAVAPGNYQLIIKVPDFKDINQAVRVTADMTPLSLSMTLNLATNIVVSDDNTEISVDPNSSLNTDVITGDALLDLPDNEDDLLAYLTQLALSKGGGDGDVTLSVDGFTGGNLPPLAQIAEIRIVNSSFSADGSTGPRIEIVTRAGSGKWTASTTSSFNDESLNAANHLTSNKKRPKSQNRNISVTSSGPVIPGKLSLNSTVSTRSTESGGSDLPAVTPAGILNSGVTSLTGGRTISLQPRYQLNKTNNITSNFTYTTSNSKNSGVGGFTLPEHASNNHSKNWQLQMSDRITKGKVVDTLRFQAQHNQSFNTPVLDNGTYSLNVTGAFTGGPSPNNSHSTSQNFLLGNTMQWQAKPKLTFSALAFELQYHRSDSDNRNNYNGTYTFSSLYDYCATLIPAFDGAQCALEQAKFAGITPKGPTTFTQTSGPSQIQVSQAELALWAQGDWRVTPKADVSFGLRYQVQQHFKDFNNLAPVVGLSYQLRSKGSWKTVVRAGVKKTDSTFAMGTYQNFRQSGSTSLQKRITIQGPSYPDPTLAGTATTSGTTNNTTVSFLAPDAVLPYNINPTFAWEQAMPKGMTVTANYSINKGYRQNRNININAPFPGTNLSDFLFSELNLKIDPTLPFDQQLDLQARKDAARASLNSMRPFYPINSGTIMDTESVGKSLTRTFSVSWRINNYNFLNNRFRLQANVSYSVTRGKDDSQWENAYDREADYSRSSSTGSRITGQLTLNTPKRITLSLTQLGWNSGRPFSITTGIDLNGDSSNSDRPFGFARNDQNGPSNYSLPQLRIAKIFVLSVPKASSAPQLGRLVSSFAEPEPQRGGGGGGGGGFNGGGGNGGGTQGVNPNRVPTGARTMQFSISAANFLNSSVRSQISGVQTSALFLQPTGGSSGRKITLQLQMKLF